jgi:hypothetical protein
MIVSSISSLEKIFYFRSTSWTRPFSLNLTRCRRKAYCCRVKIDKYRNIFRFDLYRTLFDIYELFEIKELKVKSVLDHNSHSRLCRHDI